MKCINLPFCVILAPWQPRQVDSGAQVIQVFDSWAGHLSPKDYDTFAAPYQVNRLVRSLLVP